jgi:protein-tyrosine-phosphatase
MAEAIFTKHLGVETAFSEVHAPVSSAGITAPVGSPAALYALAALRERGIGVAY